MDKETVKLADLLTTDTANYIQDWADKNDYSYDEALYDIVCSHRMNRRLKETAHLSVGG